MEIVKNKSICLQVQIDRIHLKGFKELVQGTSEPLKISHWHQEKGV